MPQAKLRRAAVPSTIDAKIEALKAKREKLLDQRGRRYARLADQAGLIEIQVGDEDLLKAFREIAERFRGSGRAQSEPVAEAEPTAERAHAAG